MRDQDKSKKQLIAELDDLRQQISELRVSETRHLQTEEDHNVLLGKVAIEQQWLTTLLDAVPCGVSITTDTSCREIRHNAVAANFLRINPWENASHSAPQPPPFKLLRGDKELLPEEMPIQQAAWLGKEVVGDEIEFVWDDGVHKFSVWNALPLRDKNGVIVGSVAAFKDYSQRKEMENELKRHREYLEELVRGRTTELVQVNEQLQQEIKARKRTEAKLRRSEARFRTIFERAAIGIALYDMTGSPLETNPTFQKMLGYNNAQLQRMDFTQFTHPEDLPRELPMSEKLLTGKLDHYQLEKRYLRKDGKPLWVHATISTIRDSGGELRYAISMIEDISERKRAEGDMNRFFSISLDLLCIVGFDGYLKRISPSFEKTLGYTGEELTSRQLREFVHPGDRKQNLSMIQQVHSGEPVVSHETRYLCKDGSFRWLEWIAIPVIEEGMIYAVGRDITVRKQLEAELCKSNQQIISILERITDAFYALDSQWRYTYLNREAEHLFPKTGAELLGRCIWDKYPRLVDTITYREFHRAVTDKVSVHFEAPSVIADHWYEYHAYPSDDGLSVFFRDITLRKQAEVVLLKSNEELERQVALRTAKLQKSNELLKQEIAQRRQTKDEILQLNEDLRRRAAELDVANKELESFSYSVSHDLRAPLRSIDGFSQALLEDYYDKLDEQGIDYLQRVRAASQRMAQLIDDLLNLSRITRSQMANNIVNLSAKARSIAAELKKTQPERQVEFKIAPNLQAGGDPRLLRIVMENLLGNAWKFTGKCPRAKIEFGANRFEGKTAFYIRDNGIGFDNAYAGKLFGAFQRLHSIAEFPGTGIGLATTKQVIHRHGGRIWAEGEVGKGATFYFTLD